MEEQGPDQETSEMRVQARRSEASRSFEILPIGKIFTLRNDDLSGAAGARAYLAPSTRTRSVPSEA
jgi:hypothetical protein